MCIRDRRRRDSNPRTACDGYTISSRAPSTGLGDFSIVKTGVDVYKRQDDTRAIQSAIDEVYQPGGGTVILPGEPENPYGRRYIVTHLVLKDNVELRIEHGAVLWQSPRIEEYQYEAVYGLSLIHIFGACKGARLRNGCIPTHFLWNIWLSEGSGI